MSPETPSETPSAELECPCCPECPECICHLSEEALAELRAPV